MTEQAQAQTEKSKKNKHLKEAEVLSRICLLFGSGFDRRSIRQRVNIDAKESLKDLHIELIKTQLNLGSNKRRETIKQLIHIGIPHTMVLEFDRCMEKSPGMTGFTLGQLGASVLKLGPEFPFNTLPAGEYLKAKAGYTLGFHLTKAKQDGTPISRVLFNFKKYVEIAEIREEDILGITQDRKDKIIAKSISKPIIKLKRGMTLAKSTTRPKAQP